MAKLLPELERYGNERCHGALDNVTLSGAYFSRKYEVVSERREIKQRTMRKSKRGIRPQRRPSLKPRTVS